MEEIQTITNLPLCARLWEMETGEAQTLPSRGSRCLWKSRRKTGAAGAQRRGCSLLLRSGEASQRRTELRHLPALSFGVQEGDGCTEPSRIVGVHQGKRWGGEMVTGQGCCISKDMGRGASSVAGLLGELSPGCTNRGIIREAQVAGPVDSSCSDTLRRVLWPVLGGTSQRPWEELGASSWNDDHRSW